MCGLGLHAVLDWALAVAGRISVGIAGGDDDATWVSMSVGRRRVARDARPRNGMQCTLLLTQHV